LKAQVSYPFSMAEALLTFLILIGVIYGTNNYTQTFIKQETVDIQTDRVGNAAMALDTYPEGHLELGLSGYSLKIESGELSMGFRDGNTSINIGENVSADTVTGPDEYTEIENLCIKKTGPDEIKFNESGC